MWKYNETVRPNDIVHRDHKYITKYRSKKSGKMVYVYPKKAATDVRNTANNNSRAVASRVARAGDGLGRRIGALRSKRIRKTMHWYRGTQGLKRIGKCTLKSISASTLAAGKAKLMKLR